jgi:5-methylcytosine-specific restriction endonuclease McrA
MKRGQETQWVAGRIYIPGVHEIPTKRAKEFIPAWLRWQVWERDDFTCKHCGARQNLAIDHVVPESKGGALTLDNLQTLCKPCNSRKGNR